jgi:hypothetical protein
MALHWRGGGELLAQLRLAIAVSADSTFTSTSHAARWAM